MLLTYCAQFMRDLFGIAKFLVNRVLCVSLRCRIVQEHIIKMYDNIASLKFARNTSSDLVVTALVSAEKEEMDLLNHVMTDSRVEEWMNVVLHEMRLANRKITKTALFYYCDHMTRLEWMMKYQVISVLKSRLMVTEVSGNYTI